ncbi:MAG: non-ribosomal peptide synthetase [Planctomycetota bacterium]
MKVDPLHSAPDWPPEIVRVSREGPSNDFIPFERSEMEQSVADRFEKMVALHPRRPAIKTPERMLTYERLNERANCLAHGILDIAGDGNDVVAVLLGNEIEMLIAIYAALKAGKCYTVLDPSFPGERLAFMYEDSAAVLCVTGGRYLDTAKDLAGRRPIIDMDSLDYGRDRANPCVEVAPDALDWVMYTSGSTGRPKGVAQSHRAQLHNIMNCVNTLHMSPEDSITQFESFAFTGTILSYFGAPLSGGCICLFDVKSSGFAGLAGWLDRERATIWSSVPAVLRHFAGGAAGRVLPSVRLVKVGGDRVTTADLDLCGRCFRPGTVLANGYGTTESGFDRQCYVELGRELSGSVIPLGYEVDDMEILILDEDGSETEPGGAGEIAVRSMYLAEGYWRRDDLTAERFASDPDNPRLRTYRTGDVGRFVGDGCLVGLGRTDFQVKVRGFRIETGEVEAALARLEGIKEAVCIARADSSGEPRLVAYVVSESGGLSVGKLRDELAGNLPAHMVPSVFVTLKRLPLSPSGKVDRNSLPPPPRGRPSLDTEYVAPRTPVEERLAAIWGETLDIDGIGANDDFQQLGGDSLRAMRLVARVLEAFDVKLDNRDLLSKPTVAQMALAVTEGLAANLEADLTGRLIGELGKEDGGEP